MSITKQSARSDIKVAIIPFTYADFLGSSGVALPAIDLPQNAIVVGGSFVIDTAFNSATSDTFVAGDGGTVNRYASAVNGQIVARTALAVTCYKYTTPDTVDIRWTGVGAVPTAGAGRLILEYIMDGRSISTQTNLS